MPSYADIRAVVQESGEDSRVEVNQRALIDKILARYASAGAVYRELLQNSNDAEATAAEIRFTTETTPSTTTSTAPAASIVSQVAYRNNGLPFRKQDWSRLRKIAEGNPNPEKVGAFGVGAYTMFSICEEPLVISGNQALAFLWKGDALWTKTVEHTQNTKDDPTGNSNPWTTFVLPSRDPYVLPDLAEFGEFLAASLTFTKCLTGVRVYVNDKLRLSITKTRTQQPRLVSTPKPQQQVSSWWSSANQVATSSPRNVFSLGSTADKAIYESLYRITVVLDGETASTEARLVSCQAQTKIPADMARRMERVTKKQPPKSVPIHIFLNAQEVDDDSKKSQTGARRITSSFAPRVGTGRIFIGFRTSQTTGLAVHVAAPFVPTVEREAMDLQDATLKLYNLELLHMAGIILRLTLHHAFAILHDEWIASAKEREALEMEYQKQLEQGGSALAVGPHPQAVDTKESQDEGDDDTVVSSTGGGLMGFARFMARGVQKKIKSALSTVEQLISEDARDSLLNPIDGRPLFPTERHAVVLMQSFCPMPSTPDTTVGMALAQGFSRCLSTAPPVLTQSGVVAGDLGRLPHQGLQAFCSQRVVRRLVYENAQEYHDVIARCRPLSLDDLIKHLRETVLTEAMAIRLIQWWKPYSRLQNPIVVETKGPLIKEELRMEHIVGKATVVIQLKDYLFYLDSNSVNYLYKKRNRLPMPETVVPNWLQEAIGSSNLQDISLKLWFHPLPMDVWTDFISHHKAMTQALKADNDLRLSILGTLQEAYQTKLGLERTQYGNLCQVLLQNRPCIPYDPPSSSTQPVAANSSKGESTSVVTRANVDVPASLYLYSAELKAFEGVGSFHKVATSLKTVGVTEDFLLALGVRKSVSIDFLFENLDSLQWSNDPRPLIEYLRTATLTADDLAKLSRSRYLPAEKESKNYGPSELYLPSPDLRNFPFCRLLQWPSEPELTERTENGRFLVRLGMKTRPSLTMILRFLSNLKEEDAEPRLRALEYLAQNMGPRGVYQMDYNRLTYQQRSQYRFLPCTTISPLSPKDNRTELLAPVHCYSEPDCAVLGFPVLNSLGSQREVFANLLQCSREPAASATIDQLLVMVELAKQQLRNCPESERKGLHALVLTVFSEVFNYLSHRSNELTPATLNNLRRECFIPCLAKDGASIAWHRPDQIFFRQQDQKDSLTRELFSMVDFSPFLAAAGVKQEATTKELFALLLVDAKKVLTALGNEKKYRALLRRIAANPPFTKVTMQIQTAPFLLAYKLEYKEANNAVDSATYDLVAARDIYIIDNSNFGRMFPVYRAPHETDLESFYEMLGSTYISKAVDRRFEVVGRPQKDTPLTKALEERVRERAPLLVSPNVTTRPLVNNAADLLDPSKLEFWQASSLMAVYSLRGLVRRSKTTCFSRSTGKNPMSRSNAVYVVDDFDWFDVGFALGDLILKRCQLEDAFFISSLLDAPLEQLRARGFPVDRILMSAKPEPEPEPPKVEPKPAAAPTIASIPPSVTPGSAAPAAKLNSDSGISSGTNTSRDLGTHESKGGNSNQPTEPEKPGPEEKGGFEEIIRQMFPDADPDFVTAALGPNPSLDTVRELAEGMATGNYPKVPDSKAAKAPPAPVAESAKKPKGAGLRQKLGRAFSGMRASSFGGAQARAPRPEPYGSMVGQDDLPGVPPVSAQSLGSGISGPSGVGGGTFVPPSGGGVRQTQQEQSGPVSPASDAQTQSSLENMLEQTVSSSADVNRQGIHSPETMLTPIPDALDRDACEVIDGQSLKPFPGTNGATRNGIRLFASRKDASSETLLRNTAVVESFAVVLENLANVFGMKMTSLAIFNEPIGKTIAFNSNRSLHFNLRYFFALHFQNGKANSKECYSYWYMTMAHELAHNLVSAHTKEHGFYTESFATHYLPKLMQFLAAI